MSNQIYPDRSPPEWESNPLQAINKDVIDSLIARGQNELAALYQQQIIANSKG